MSVRTKRYQSLCLFIFSYESSHRLLARDARTVRPTRCASRCSPFGDNIALMPYFVLILLLFAAPVRAGKRKRDGVQFCNFHGERHFPLSGTVDLAPIRSYGATNAT